MLAQMTASGFSPDQARMMLANMVDKEAIAMAVDYVFLVSTIVLLVAACFVWMAPRVKLTRLMGPEEGGH